jgi:hypothetical protein
MLRATTNRPGCWCERGELNPHGCPLDPKSSASANSATLATNVSEIRKLFSKITFSNSSQGVYADLSMSRGLVKPAHQIHHVIFDSGFHLVRQSLEKTDHGSVVERCVRYQTTDAVIFGRFGQFVKDDLG